MQHDDESGAKNEADPLLPAAAANTAATPASPLSIATGDSSGADETSPTSSPERRASSTPSRLSGRLTLAFVAFLYGTLNVTLRMLYALPGPPSASALSSSRGWLAVAALSPLLPKIRGEMSSLSRDDAPAPGKVGPARTLPPLWAAALELAVWNFGAQGLLNVGLLFTDAARAAFFTQTSVALTPLLSLFAGQRVSRSVWLGCMLALVGLVLLSASGSDSDGAPTSHGAERSALYLSGGDLIVLGGALSWSMYIFRVSSVGDRYPELSLQAIKLVLLACLYSTWFLSSASRCYAAGGWEEAAGLWGGWAEWRAWALLAYSAAGPGALADILQQRGQREVSASEANVILCGEPVFTAILARILLGETTSAVETAGGALIVVAAVVSSR